jgi:hypothetical protein
MTTTPETIAELKRLLAEATPGQWWNESGTIHCKAPEWTEANHACCHPVRCETDEEADLIAAAVNALPSLLSDLEAAQKREQVLREALNSAADELTRLIERGNDASRSTLASVCAALAATEVQP